MDNQLKALGLTEQDGRVIVSSRDIARVFEKRHDNVIRDIRNIIGNDPKWGLLNFEESNYINEQNHIQPSYVLNRDGFTILVMGYTGEKAMSFKKAYIAAFHEMEHRLASRNYKAVLLALVAKEEERESLQAQNQVDGATVTQKGRSTRP